VEKTLEEVEQVVLVVVLHTTLVKQQHQQMRQVLLVQILSETLGELLLAQATTQELAGVAPELTLPRLQLQ
jgi:hypothetical protein